MTKDEALKLAFKALEQAWEAMTDYMAAHKTMPATLISASAVSDKAITAIKEALAQPERDPWRAAAAQPEQRPAAWEQFHEHLVERNFCPRCGKRRGGDVNYIHTCTPPREGT